jgi:hypothetical protein
MLAGIASRKTPRISHQAAQFHNFAGPSFESTLATNTPLEMRRQVVP